ncbi:MAG: hypothetical protein WA080_04200 [Sulfuricurvum sp.]
MSKPFDEWNEVKKETRVVECEKAIDAMVYALYGLSADEINIVEEK